MRAAGEPTSVDELRGPPPSDDVNAAPEIAAALKWAQDAAGDSSGWPRLAREFGDPPLTDAERRAAEEFVARLLPFVHRVEAALARPRCAFPSARDDRPEAFGETSPTVIDTWSLLSTIARNAGDPDERIEACRALMLLAVRLETHDELDRTVHTLAIVNDCTTAMQTGLESGGWDPGRARARLDDVLAEPWLARTKRIVTEYRVGEIERYEIDLERKDRSSNGTVRHIADAGSTDDLIASAASWREMAELPTTSYVQYRAGVRKLHAGLASWIFCDGGTFARVEAECRLARVALALAEHRRKYGDFPERLDELSSAFPDGVPLDPFTDAPFNYVLDERSVWISTRGLFADEIRNDDGNGPVVGLMLWMLKR
jgi:hypothetical protein